MKKCPFCMADIEENARFCLYCMKPLQEKKEILPPKKGKRWWLFLVLGGILLTAAVIIALLLKNPKNTTGESLQVLAPVETTQRVTAETTQPPVTTPEETQLQVTEPDITLPQETQPQVTQPPETQPPTTQPTETTPPATQETKPVETQPEETKPVETQPQETKPVETQPESPKSDVEYIYREARAGDEYHALYQNDGNDIVITGVAKIAEDGVYDIPAYIDGKKVIAIMANAFYESGARIVYIPETIRVVWNYAFYGCPLEDVYFRGNSIYAEWDAFWGSFVIHCSADCSDRSFRYYKNTAESYGATWEEWNG